MPRKKEAPLPLYMPHCSMRCCSRLWVKDNNLSDTEVRHFKKLADDLFGFMLHCGYSPLDFPSILHVFATFTAPGVLAAYRRANQYTGEELEMRELLKERTTVNKEYREHQKEVIRALDDETSPLVSKIKERRGKALFSKDYEPYENPTIKIETPDNNFKNETESEENKSIPPRGDILADLGEARGQTQSETKPS